VEGPVVALRLPPVSYIASALLRRTSQRSKLLVRWEVVIVCHCRYCTYHANPAANHQCKCKCNALHHPQPRHFILCTNPSPLVRGRRLLARLQLVQVPPADGQVALVLRHAVVEALDVASAGAGRLLALLHLLVLLREVGVLGRGLGGRGAATEEAADGVADGGADCDTAGGC
jgi:hypothetical protein